MIKPAPSIHASSQEERAAYVEEQWQCLNHCASCGKCNILKGRDEQILYLDYIEGKTEYRDITKKIQEGTDA